MVILDTADVKEYKVWKGRCTLETVDYSPQVQIIRGWVPHWKLRTSDPNYIVSEGLTLEPVDL